eukprot:3125969-Amphidinium_carterae.1
MLLYRFNFAISNTRSVAYISATWMCQRDAKQPERGDATCQRFGTDLLSRWSKWCKRIVVHVVTQCCCMLCLDDTFWQRHARRRSGGTTWAWRKSMMQRTELDKLPNAGTLLD